MRISGSMLISAIRLSCLFFLSSPIISQVIYERTYPYGSISVDFPVELSDTSTFSFDNDNMCGGIGVRHIDRYGNELAENWFGAEGFSSGYYWIGHDSVLIWAVEGAWDAGVDSFRVYIWTPDTTIKIVSRYMAHDAREVIGGAFLYTSDRLVYRQSDTLFTLNMINGIEEDSLVIPDIYSVIEFEKSILVVSNASYPVLLNDRLEVIGIWADLSFLPFNVNEDLVLDSFLLGIDLLHPLAISTFNIYSESQMNIDLSGYFDQIDEIQSNKNNLFIKGKSAGEDMILQLDSAFSFVDLQPLEIPELDKEMNFQFYPGRVYASGYDGYTTYKANYRVCYPYKNPTPIQYVDISLDTMWVDTLYIFPPEWHVPPSMKGSAVISNLSPDTLKGLTMYFIDIPVFWCNNGVYVSILEGLQILPFESDTITFGTWAHSTSLELPVIRRFFVEHGNNHLDLNFSNNSFVLNYLISGNAELTPFNATVFPNPFTDFLQVYDMSETIQMDLYDQTGRMVSGGYGWLDNLGGLPNGVYFLHVQDGNSISIQRVVKVE